MHCILMIYLQAILNFLLTWVFLPIVHCDVDGLQTHFLPLDEEVGEVGFAHVVAKHPRIPEQPSHFYC